MAERLAFLLGKDPATARGGDVTMFRTLRAIAEERFETELICLSETADPDAADPRAPADVPGVTRVAKPAVHLPSLLVRSVVGRRSVVHTRFDVDGLRDAVRRSTADRFVAVHSYMAEPYLRAPGAEPSRDLLVSTEVPESSVWRATRGVAGHVEARRLAHDEWRVARLARAIGGYDDSEVAGYRARGIARAYWLPVTLPPAERVDVAASPPRLVLLGNRTWAPNAEAAETLLRWWPEIAAGIPGAELLLVGPRPDRTRHALPAGVTDLGLVPDVGPILAGCRALAAPIAVGGGVRVKVLEAAAHGLPVVTRAAGIGSTEAALGLSGVNGRGAFVAECRRLLLDPDAAAESGARLYDANARRWAERVGQEAVLRWLSA